MYAVKVRESLVRLVSKKSERVKRDIVLNVRPTIFIVFNCAALILISSSIGITVVEFPPATPGLTPSQKILFCTFLSFCPVSSVRNFKFSNFQFHEMFPYARKAIISRPNKFSVNGQRQTLFKFMNFCTLFSLHMLSGRARNICMFYNCISIILCRTNV